MKRVHAFLLILLMLTVPLQAMAGKVALCESQHAAALAVSSAIQDASAHQMKGHEHHEEMQHAFLQMEEEHHAGAMDTSASADNHAGGCSVCTSCPMGVVGIAINPFYLPSTDLLSAGIAYSAFHIPDAVPELPDNPPRA